MWEQRLGVWEELEEGKRQEGNCVIVFLTKILIKNSQNAQIINQMAINNRWNFYRIFLMKTL